MKIYTLLTLLLWVITPASATHLLGGQIQARYLTGTQYEITVLLYTDDASLPASDAMNTISVCLGDGNTTNIVRTSRRSVQGISINLYRTTYAYTGPGVYRVNLAMQNRTQMVNLLNVNENTLALSTTIQAVGGIQNSTPVVDSNPATWQASINQKTTLNLNSNDADGDSLSYLLTKPLTTPQATTCTTPIPLGQYVFPNAVAQRGTYKLNSRTGDLVWDAPTVAGQYTVSVLIREWRNGTLIGESYVETVLRVQDKGGPGSVIPPYEPAVEQPALVTGVEEQREAEFLFVISPNPVHDHLQAHLELNRATAATIQLLDLSGRMILEQKLPLPRQTHDCSVNTDGLPAGFYIIRANVNGRMVSRKVMKQ